MPEVRRFAVVLFFLPEGESEREMGGNPPTPPVATGSPWGVGSVSGRTLGGAPGTPLALKKIRSSPKVPKVHVGLSEPSNTSYTYEKVAHGHFGSAKVLKSAQGALWRFWTLKCGP